MLDYKKVDRILVSSNEKMDIVLNWYLANKDQLKELEFIAPLKKGYVHLREENLGFSFESKGKMVEIIVCVYNPDDKDQFIAPIATFTLNPANENISNVIVHATGANKKRMQMVLTFDNTLYKEATKYLALMSFLIYYREEVEIEEEENVNKTYKKSKPHKPAAGSHSTPFIRRTYVLNKINRKNLKKIDGKGFHNSPSYEFEVRGFYRHYKSGKVVWVDGFTKCKGKGPARNKNYKL